MNERAEQETYAGRRVHFRASITPDEATFVIRDDGPGFDPSTIVKAKSSEAMTTGTGRGLVLMNSFMDEVTFNDQGNEVTLIYRNK